MKAWLIAGCAALALIGLAPEQAKADRNHHRHRGGVHVDVQIGGHGGYYSSGPVICHPPRPVYRPAPVYCPPPVVYRPAPVYCPPPVYHRPVYRQPVYQGGGYNHHYRGGYSSRHCDW